MFKKRVGEQAVQSDKCLKQSSEDGFSLRTWGPRKGLVYLRVSSRRAAGKTVISGKSQVSFEART